MSDYKVGDKVKVVSVLAPDTQIDISVGDVLTVTRTNYPTGVLTDALGEGRGGYFMAYDQIEPVNKVVDTIQLETGKLTDTIQQYHKLGYRVEVTIAEDAMSTFGGWDAPIPMYELKVIKQNKTTL